MSAFDEALLEREAELGDLERRLDAAAGGSGQLVLLEGPAGIGKTRLLAETRAAAAARGMEVLTARGDDLERDVPYGIVRQLFEMPVLRAPPPLRQSLLRGAAGFAAAVLAVGETADAASDVGERSASALHGLYWLTSNLAEPGPLLVAVDDAHWADRASLGFVSYLSRRIEDMPVLLVLTLRPSEPIGAREPVARLRADSRARVLEISPLTPAGAAQLVRSALGADAADEFCRACHAATGGNPFLLSELVGALRTDGVAPTVHAISQVSGLVPAAVRRQAFARLLQLPDAAASLARALAVLGSRTDLRQAAALADLDDTDAAAAADALAAADLLAAGEPLEFVHPLVREAIYAELPPAERARAHARVAELLVADGAPPDRIAAQLIAGAPAGAEWAVDVLREASREAVARGAPDAAVTYLRRALTEPPPAAALAQVLDELGSAEGLAGDPRDVEHLRRALELTPPGRSRALVARRLAQALTARDFFEEAVSTLDAAIAELDDGERELALLLEADAATTGRMHRSTYPSTIERLRRLASEIRGSSPAERLLLTNLAFEHVLQGGSAAGAAALAERAIAGGVLSDHAPAPSALYDGVYALIVADAFDSAQHACDAALANARAHGSLWGIAAASLLRSHLAVRRGSISRAVSDARTALHAATTGDLALVPTTAAFLVDALVERGELDAAASVIEQHAPDPIPDAFFPNFLLYSRGRLRIAAGDAAGGLSDLHELGAREERWRGRGNPGVFAYRSTAAVALAQLGDHAEARRLAEQEFRLAEEWGTPRAIGVALRARGIVEGEAGLPDLRRAVETLGGSGARLEHARALADLGAALRRAGRRNDARHCLRRGLDLARRCGAIALAERAHQELLAAGARPRRLDTSGAESLTPSERRVAAMAARGHPNRDIAQTLFVSLKTVEMHLGSSYRKLGIKSRSELARALEPSAVETSPES